MKTTFLFLSIIVLLASCNKQQDYRKLKTDFIVGDTLIAVGDILDVKNTGDTVNVNFFWDFGDGQYSTDINPVHYYDAPGVYTIILQVTGNLGNIYSIAHRVRVGERYIYELELLNIDEHKYFSPKDFWDEDSTGSKALPDIFFAIMGLNDFNHTDILYKTKTIYNVNQKDLPISFQIPDIKITPYNGYEMGPNTFGLFLYDKDGNNYEEIMSNWMSGISGSNYIYNKKEHKGEFTLALFGSFKVKFKIK